MFCSSCKPPGSSLVCVGPHGGSVGALLGVAARAIRQRSFEPITTMVQVRSFDGAQHVRRQHPTLTWLWAGRRVGEAAQSAEESAAGSGASSGRRQPALPLHTYHPNLTPALAHCPGCRPQLAQLADPMQGPPLMVDGAPVLTAPRAAWEGWLRGFAPFDTAYSSDNMEALIEVRAGLLHSAALAV